MENPQFAVVGGDTLLGQEIREVVQDQKLAVQLKMISSSEEGFGILTAQEQEAAVIGPLEVEKESLADCEVALLAGSPASSRKTYATLSQVKPMPLIIDMTSGLEDQPDARVRAPLVEPKDYQAPAGAIQVIAHPAAIALALFFGRLHRRHPIRRSVVQIFEPASEHGRRGIGELQQQTVSLLSFKPLEKAVFDTQVSFNLLPSYGEESAENLAQVENRIDRHLTTLLALQGQLPMPSFRVAHAPVFHGYTFSLWVEFEENPGPVIAAQALASAQVEIREKEHEAPSNVGVAGQSGITVGAIERDHNDPRACWFWMVADNLRLTAENALLVARSLTPEISEGGAG